MSREEKRARGAASWVGRGAWVGDVERDWAVKRVGFGVRGGLVSGMCFCGERMSGSTKRGMM